MECADKSYEIENEVQVLSQGSTETNVDACCWCTGSFEDENVDYDQLLLCDKCPRSFCKRCVALAHDIGEDGWKIANDLCSDESEWSCLACKPPKALKNMQEFLSRQQIRNDITKTIANNNDAESSFAPSNENLVTELILAEQMKDEAEEYLEEENMNEVYESILCELREHNKSDNLLPPSDIGTLRDFAHEEIGLLEEMWRDHLSRSIDAISNIQDSLGECSCRLFLMIILIM